ncbi:PfkB family carbohydrate kinase [Corynebacterium pacaense]|uniref:PfkB family carbohydrate kinase n=1 Tax=Corynebacterium pacaense TaxID=1816684 RepID=UPI0009BA8C0C|nr:PfkB family carbohydrate kinase [Corynebacterium pacaense]
MKADRDAQRAHRGVAEFNRQPADVLLIGSQVVYGAVGITGALPIYHDAGMRVLALPTVILSSMPHYANSHRSVQPAQWIGQTMDDLLELGLIDEISTVVTGYFASPEQIEVVADRLRGIRTTHPHLRFVVDPTVGDSDVGVYTAPGIAEALAAHLIPQATGLTPNVFEFDHFTGEGDPVTRARGLLGPRGRWVVVTSASHDEDTVSNLIVTRTAVHEVSAPHIDSGAKGTGDVFTAALVAGLHRGMELVDAAAAAAAAVSGGLGVDKHG